MDQLGRKYLLAWLLALAMFPACNAVLAQAQPLQFYPLEIDRLFTSEAELAEFLDARDLSVLMSARVDDAQTLAIASDPTHTHLYAIRLERRPDQALHARLELTGQYLDYEAVDWHPTLNLRFRRKAHYHLPLLARTWQADSTQVLPERFSSPGWSTALAAFSISDQEDEGVCLNKVTISGKHIAQCGLTTGLHEQYMRLIKEEADPDLIASLSKALDASNARMGAVILRVHRDGRWALLVLPNRPGEAIVWAEGKSYRIPAFRIRSDALPSIPKASEVLVQDLIPALETENMRPVAAMNVRHLERYPDGVRLTILKQPDGHAWYAIFGDQPYPGESTETAFIYATGYALNDYYGQPEGSSLIDLQMLARGPGVAQNEDNHYGKLALEAREQGARLVLQGWLVNQANQTIGNCWSVFADLQSQNFIIFESNDLGETRVVHRGDNFRFNPAFFE